MAADRISAAVYISAFADLVITFCKKHFSLLQSCVCIKFDLQNAIFKFSVVDNTDIFDADLFCCKDGCDGCNGTGLICHIDIKDIGTGDQAVVYNVNGVTVILELANTSKMLSASLLSMEQRIWISIRINSSRTVEMFF